MDARALLFGSKLRIAATVLGGLGLVVGGAFAAGVLGVPSVERVENRFGDVDEAETAIETDLVVQNPNPVGVRLGGLRVDYAVSMNDVEMARGEKRGVGVGAGNSTVNLTTYLQNDRVPEWWVSHVRNGETTAMTVDATVRSSTLGQSTSFQPASRTIETDVIGQFNSSEDRPVNADAPLVEDPVLVIERTNASWGEVTAAETPIDIEFRVYNPKASPVVVSNVGYNITMNDVQVGSGETEDTTTIPGKTSRVVETPTAMSNERLDEWWVSHVRNDQTTELRIDFYAEVEPPGSDDPVRVPLDGMTYTKTIETDMFGTKADASGEGGSDGGEGTTGDGDATTSEGEATGDGTTSGTTSEEDGTTSGDGTTATSDNSTTSDDSTTTDDGILARGAAA
ncbi:LEA type 2 family protein [Halobacterium yunchengense]|uniref:LEA type 2 family protein n=1 Tax=Halobacterium yunchengense TaxID=3108497 RepID=UPI0030088A82